MLGASVTTCYIYNRTSKRLHLTQNAVFWQEITWLNARSDNENFLSFKMIKRVLKNFVTMQGVFTYLIPSLQFIYIFLAIPLIVCSMN